MAQFDSLIILPLILSLLIIIFIYYHISIKIIIPDYCGVKKFRKKKSNSPFFCLFFKNNNTAINLTSSYKPIF